MANNSQLWSGIVGNAAEALRHPGLTAALRNMHPGTLPAPAKGGIAAYADGGAVASGADPAMPPMPAPDSGQLPDMNDPRMGAIADAEDALATAHDGEPLQPHHVDALQHFTDTYGLPALQHLHANVKAGMTARPRRARLVVGQSGNDKVPAEIDGVHKAKLSTGEFVMPTDAVAGAGNGDPIVGAQRLHGLSQQLAALKPAKAVAPATEATLDKPVAAVKSMQPPLNVDAVG